MNLRFDRAQPRGWQSSVELSDEARWLMDLYAPLCGPGSAVRVLAHLGQSMDGFVADRHGHSKELSSPENIVHLHRLRALFDAVVVGRLTATEDNPKLTTRLVEGPSPVRVVLDPRLASDPGLNLFGDALAPTIVLCAQDAPKRSFPSETQVLRAAVPTERASLTEFLTVLRAEGLERVFVEGGGVTVSRALEERALDRLHVAVAPAFLGQGRPGVRLGQGRELETALRPPSAHFEMGGDVLFDFELDAASSE